MIVPRYVPGEWFAAVTDGTVGLLPPSASADLVARLWASLREDVGLGEHLQVLVSDGLAALPPFALVRLGDGRVQTVVRGPVVVEVSTADGPRVLSGADVTTWSEATVAGATAVTVRAADAVAGAADDLPVLSAVVRASVVGVVLDRDGVVDHEEPAAAEDASADDPTGAEPAPVRRRDQRAATPPSGVPVTEPVGAVEQVAAPAAQPTPAAPPTAHTDAPPAAIAAPAPPAPTPAPAPPAPPAPADVPAASADPDADADADADAEGADHDGLTVLSSDVVALRRQLPEWAGDAVPGPFAVPAPEAPPVAKIHLSSGLVIALNRPVLLGRAPQVSRVTNSRLPRLVTVASPNQDISRTHAEVRQEGEHVLVTDLRSTNGVLLLRQGHGPQRLHPAEPTVVEPGVVVDLGEGVTFTVEHG